MKRSDSGAPINIPFESWDLLWKQNTRDTADSKSEKYCDPFEVLFRIQRGLAGHVSFLATCDAKIVFTEYLLYEPILWILRQMDYDVKCEVPCIGQDAESTGDSKRIDFVAEKSGSTIALEIKWLRWDDDDVEYLDIKRDTEKLISALNGHQASQCFLCVFGRHSQIAEFRGKKAATQLAKYNEALPPVYADLRRTIYGCRIYQLRNDQVAGP